MEKIKRRIAIKSLVALSVGIALNTTAFIHFDITPKSIISEGNSRISDARNIEVISEKWFVKFGREDLSSLCIIEFH